MTLRVEEARDSALAPDLQARSRIVAVLYATTSFSGAAMLFVVQPMVARMVLPEFGGSATVWSTSSLFFQVVLMLGYLYAHGSTRWRDGAGQPWLHFGVLLLPLAALPIALPAGAAVDAASSPLLSLLRTLTILVGLPFAVLSTTGPLLQRWYASTAGPRAGDPYFLFAAGNLGSFVGLLAYPLAIEPRLTLEQQRFCWSVAFIVLMVLVASCGVAVLLGGSQPTVAGAVLSPASEPISRQQLVRWFGLALLPSSLMLGVTAHISADVASVPLLWVVPLAIYLATFVVAFARQSRQLPVQVTRVAAALASVAAVWWFVRQGQAVLPQIAVDLALLGATGLAAHVRLAADRPAPTNLTVFYLVVSAGGAAGGLINGLLAPLVLDRVWEYPVALLAVLALSLRSSSPPWRGLELRYHPGFVRLVEAFFFAVVLLVGLMTTERISGSGAVALAAVGLALLGLAWLMASRPLPLLAAVCLLILAPTLVFGGDEMYVSRTFYGAYRVTGDGQRHDLVHGTTSHGSQWTGSRASEPTTYYSADGPVGDLFRHLPGARDIGVVGLGAGTLAAYGKGGQTLTFFEIDPEVVRIATDPRLFTYLRDTRASTRVVTGDGRLSLTATPDGSFDLLILDAFSSDAIPVHLLTQEAFRLYASKLRPGGTLMVHISNRVFDLEPVVAAAGDRLGWRVAVGAGSSSAGGAMPSRWVALSSTGKTIGDLLGLDDWRPPHSRRVAWTDDHSSVLTVLNGW